MALYLKAKMLQKLLNWLDTLEVGIYNTGVENEDIKKTTWMKWKKVIKVM